MENTWPPNEAFLPISDFSLITPLIMAIFCVTVLAYNMLRSRTKTADLHLKYQKLAGTMPAVYNQASTGDPKKGRVVQVNSSNIARKTNWSSLYKSKDGIATKQKTSKISSDNPDSKSTQDGQKKTNSLKNRAKSSNTK